MKISVCIATYNGSAFIQQQIASILPQLRAEDEVIISDDSSTDNTLEVIRSFDDSRIKIYSDQKFKNPIFNFENAINKSTGDIIFLSDQDDIWAADKVEKMSSNLTEYDLAVSDCSFIDDANKIITNSYFDIVKSGPGLFKNLKKNTYFGCCMAFKRVVLKKALPFPKHIPMHDIWLGFVGDLFYNVIFIPEPLTLYRKHQNNVSIASDVISNFGILKKIKFRMNLLRYLPNLLIR